jgi:hypothetical protein
MPGGVSELEELTEDDVNHRLLKGDDELVIKVHGYTESATNDTESSATPVGDRENRQEHLKLSTPSSSSATLVEKNPRKPDKPVDFGAHLEKGAKLALDVNNLVKLATDSFIRIRDLQR